MKCEVTVAGLGEDLIGKLNKLRRTILMVVLVPHLNVSMEFGPSEFCVPVCNRADDETHRPFCEVRLTGVSVNENRSARDFARARIALEQVYWRTISQSRSADDPDVELSVSIMLDRALPNGSTLVENSPSMVRYRSLV